MHDRVCTILACPTRRASASSLAPSVREFPSRLRASRELSSRQSSSPESALWPPASSCSERPVARAPGARRRGRRPAPARLSPPEPLPRMPSAAGATDCPRPDASPRLGRHHSSTRRRPGETRADGAPRPGTPIRDRRGSGPRTGNHYPRDARSNEQGRPGREVTPEAPCGKAPRYPDARASTSLGSAARLDMPRTGEIQASRRGSPGSRLAWNNASETCVQASRR